MSPGRFPRPCITCGVLTIGESYCADHKPVRTRPDTGRRREKKKFLYGKHYKRIAKAVREGGSVCHLCGQGPREGDPFEADHVNPELGFMSELKAAHRSCNRKRGNKPLS